MSPTYNTQEKALAELQAHFDSINVPPMGWTSNIRLYEVVEGVARRRHDYPQLKHASLALQVQRRENPENDYGLMFSCIASVGQGFIKRIWGYYDVPDRAIHLVALHFGCAGHRLTATALVDGWPKFAPLRVPDPSSEIGKVAAKCAESVKRYMEGAL
jgi:hypothetical protein